MCSRRLVQGMRVSRHRARIHNFQLSSSTWYFRSQVSELAVQVVADGAQVMRNEPPNTLRAVLLHVNTSALATAPSDVGPRDNLPHMLPQDVKVWLTHAMALHKHVAVRHTSCAVRARRGILTAIGPSGTLFNSVIGTGYELAVVKYAAGPLQSVADVVAM